MGKAVSRCITVTTVVDGTDGYNTAVVQLFRRYTPTQAAPTPALPTGTLTYTFSTGKLTGPSSYFNGWSQDMPNAASGEKLFVTMATARSQEDTDSIVANEWSPPVEYVADGANAKYIYLRGTGQNRPAARILNITSSDNIFSSYQSRGFVTARINKNTLVTSDITWFDVYGGTSEGGESAENANLARTKFITYLTNTTADYFLAIASRDAVGFNDAMVAKLREFGLGKLDYTAVSGVDGFRTPFAFLGYRGLQQGYALYQLQGTEATAPYAEAMAYIANGVFMSAKDGEDGADGTSPYFADIDNEMDSVALDVSGNTTAAYSKTIGVMLWHGSEEMTLTDIVISGTTAAVTATKNVANKTITISVAAGTSIPLTTELTITPQATGAPNDQSVHFVLNGVKPGANGQHATLYSLIPDADVITKEADGTPTFDILNFTIIKRVGTAETVITSISSFSNEGLKLYYKVGSGSEVEVTTSYMSNGGYTNVNYHDIEQLYGATDEKIEWILRKASNNQLLDKEGIGSVKDGAASTVPGPAAVEYKISLAGSVLANDPNTGKLIVSIVGRVYKTEGDTTTPYTALTKSNLYLYFEKADGSVSQVPAGDISVSDNQFTTTCQNGANYSNEVLFGVRFAIDNVIKARESIQVVKYGTNGQSITGHTGRFFYYAGDYSGVPGNYAMQETQGPYVKVTNGANIEFWMLDFKGVEPASFPARATEAPSDQSTQWTKMSSQQQYYIARAFFGPYAHFGSFVINGDWMISQYGTLVDSSGTKTIVNAYNVDTLFNGKVPYAWFAPTDPTAGTAPSSGYKFAPNFAVDGLAGKTYQNDAYIRGEVHATSGEFTGKVTAQSGNIGGFEIGTDRLYNTNWNAGIDINPNDGRNVKIGKNAQGVIGTESAIIRAENTRPNQTYNTAMYLNAQNGEYNYALYGNGNGVLNGLMFGYKVQLHTIPSGDTDAVTYLNIKSGSTIILNGSHSDGHVWIAAPKLSEVRKCLGINSTTTPFAIEFTVVSHANYEYVSIVFRNAITETQYSEYPWLMNTDDGHIGEPFGSPSVQIATGDIVKILLLYDNVGTTSNPNYEYRAYDLIRRV